MEHQFTVRYDTWTFPVHSPPLLSMIVWIEGYFGNRQMDDTTDHLPIAHSRLNELFVCL